MRDRFDEVTKAGLVVLGVSFDSREENHAFRLKYDFPFRLLCDTDRTLGLAYGAAKSADQGSASRISYVLDEQGMVLLAYPRVKAALHLDQVLTDLAELAQPEPV